MVTVTVAVRAQWDILGARRRVRRGMQHGCLSSLGLGLPGANGPVEDFEVVGELGYADRSNRTDDAAPWPMCWSASAANIGAGLIAEAIETQREPNTLRCLNAGYSSPACSRMGWL